MDFLLYLALIPALGLTAQWLAWRTRLPGILLLLVFGVLLGLFVQPDAYLVALTGGDETAGPEILFPLVSLAVAVIMFEGGLSLKLGELREAGGAALRLCTVGALVTMAGATIGAHYTLGFSWRLSCLLGAILIVTGPTVIGPLLRQIRPSRRVAATLKWEGIVIDPIGAVMAVLVFDQLILSRDEVSLAAAAFTLTGTIAVGTTLGAAGGAALTYAFRRFLVPDHLHGVASLSVGLLLFAISNHFAHESGLITVTVLGIWLANQQHFDIEHIVEFKEHLRTLLIGCLFIVLGSRVDLNDLAAIGWPGLLFVGFLITIVRPVSAFVSLYRSPLNLSERAFISAVAPRGIVAAAVSSVFALEMERLSLADTIPGSDQLATVTFLVIVGTVTVYGIAAAPLARWLGLAVQDTRGILIAGADDWVRDFAAELKSLEIPVVLVDTNFNKVDKANMAGMEAICANILNEHVQEDLPLSGIGRMMAMTQNDEVNSLAIRECRTTFDRSNLYQLSFDVANSHHRRGMTKNLMGRELFGTGMTFSAIRELHHLGATFKATPLSDTFTFDSFTQLYGNSPKLLCVIDENGKLLVNTVDDPLQPEAGQTIITLVMSTAVPDDHAALNSKSNS
jgi:NhaP-type Na+/H+ or K+/H+ antiporter